MMKVLQVMAALFVGIVLLFLYPSYITFINIGFTAASSISTPDTLVRLFFEALPLLGLVFIVWVIYKAMTAKRIGW